MTTNTKIFVLLLLASAIGLNSCVNQVKRDPIPQVLIDTNYLHGLAKVQILFSYSDSMGVFHHTTRGTIPHINWNGNYFILNAYYMWRDSSSVWNRDGGSESFTLTGHISFSGDKIDSGSFKYDYGFDYMNRPGEGTDNRETILKYELLPFQESDSNKLEYSLMGTALESIITQYRDSTYGGYQLNKYSYELDKNKILWNEQPPPTLTVTFSK